jgi:integrase
MTQENASGHVFLVKRKRGVQWYAKYRIGDRQVQKRLGPAHTGKGRPPAGHFTKRTAEQALEAILTDARRGQLATPSGQTFRQAADSYLDSCDVQPKTLRDYRGAIDGRLNPEFGDRRLEDIKPKDIDRWRRTLDVSPRTVVRYLTVMHSVFRHARVRDNPASAENLTYPKVKYSGEFVAYDREEIDQLVAAAATTDRPLFLVAALTGLRQGELLALRWRSVDFVTGMLHVRHSFGTDGEKAPKSGKVRAVPMMPDVVNALATLKNRGYLAEDDDLVFCNSAGDHLDSWALRRRFYRAVKAAGLRRIRFHDLRHTFGTTAARVLSLSDLQHYMGHQHAVTTQRYIHHQPRPEDAAKLADAFRVPDRVPNPPSSDRTESNSRDGIPQ